MFSFFFIKKKKNKFSGKRKLNNDSNKKIINVKKKKLKLEKKSNKTKNNNNDYEEDVILNYDINGNKSKKKDDKKIIKKNTTLKKNTKIKKENIVNLTLLKFILIIFKTLKHLSKNYKNLHLIEDLSHRRDILSNVILKNLIFFITNDDNNDNTSSSYNEDDENCNFEKLFNSKDFEKFENFDLNLEIIELLILHIEKKHINLLFSRECLKYFLTNWVYNLTISDFKINANVKNSKNSNSSKLTNGAILIEYSKFNSSIKNLLSRCEEDDYNALMLILKYNFLLKKDIYKHLMNNTKYIEYPIYNSEKPLKTLCQNVIIDEEEYVKISMSNLKRQLLLISKHSLLIHDGNQFTLPTNNNVEKDFNFSEIFKLDFTNNNEFIIFEILSNNNNSKNKIIDIYKFSNSEKQQFVENLTYEERRKFINENLFKHKNKNNSNLLLNDDEQQQQQQNFNNKIIKLVDIDNDFRFNDSYLFKHVKNLNKNFIYLKKNHVCVVLGICGENLLMGYRTDNDEYIYKFQIPNTGPTSQQIFLLFKRENLFSKLTPSSSIYDSSNDNNKKKAVVVTIDDKKILNLDEFLNLPNAYYLNPLLKVEIKDNKLGKIVISKDKEVTHINEFKESNKDNLIEKHKQYLDDHGDVRKIATGFAMSKNYRPLMKIIKENEAAAAAESITSAASTKS